jgi:uncharacterized membrane protein
MMSERLPPGLELQIRVSKILCLGFVFTIMSLGGLGSLVALILGLKARKIINQSHGEIIGIRLAWWCIIIGALGTILLPLQIISELRNNWK